MCMKDCFRPIFIIFLNILLSQLNLAIPIADFAPPPPPYESFSQVTSVYVGDLSVGY
jgi:hypothetical protein